MNWSRHLLIELRRRRVFRTAGLYLVGAWLLIQIGTSTFEYLGLPASTVTFLIWAVVIGFPICLLLGWRYQLGPGGITRTAPAGNEEFNTSLRPRDYAIFALVIAVVGTLSYGIVGDIVEPPASTGIGEIAVQADPNTIAVLPFDDESADSEDRYLSVGIAEELRLALRSVAELRVAARASSMLARQEALDLRLTAQRLGVSTLVAGSVERQGDNLQISVEVIDGQTAISDWSKIYRASLEQLIDLHRMIAADVIEQIVPGADPSVIDQAPTTENVSAHERFLLARSLEQEALDQQVLDVGKLQRAVELYRQVIDADTSYARAHSRLGTLLIYMGDMPGAREEIRSARELDPHSADVYYTLGLYRQRWDLDGVSDAFREAIDIDPNHAEALSAYAMRLWAHGDSEKPERYFREALAIDRLLPIRYRELGNYLGLTGKTQEAREIIEEVLRRFPDERGFLVATRIYELIGELDEAIAWALEAKAVSPDDETIDWQLSELFARIGDPDMADRFDSTDPSRPTLGKLFHLRRYRELIEVGELRANEDPRDLNLWNLLGHAYNARGNPDDTVVIMELLGQPQIARRESKESIEIEGMAIYMSALEATGDRDRAGELAQELTDYTANLWATGGDYPWWPNLYRACALAVQGRVTEALDHLEKLRDAPGLVWYPLLKDALCLQKLRNDPRYLAVVDDIEARMSRLRQRVPATLSTHGITL